MNCQRCFLGQMWLVILNNSRALPQICRGAAPICMVVVLVLKVVIGSTPSPDDRNSILANDANRAIWG